MLKTYIKVVLVLFSLIYVTNGQKGFNQTKEFEPLDLTTDQFQLDCILIHNDLREKHCSPPMKYSSKLRALATRRATLLAQTDGRFLTRLMDSTFGENIYRHRFNPKSNTTNCKTIVQNWYKEKARYYAEHKVGVYSRRFAQLVWNATQHLGCATVASTNPGGHVYTICNYYNSVKFPINATQNVISVENCDKRLSTRKFKTKRLTNAHWLQECMNEHNAIRKKHSVDPFTITDQLFQAALKRVTEMAQRGFRFFRHLKSSESKYGENIHWTKSRNHLNQTNSTSDLLSISCNVSIGKWYKERYNYDWDYREKHNGTVRHFVQLVWKESTAVACAQVENIEEKKGGVYTVCLYEPKAEYRESDLSWENVFPENFQQQTEEPVLVTVVIPEYEHIDELDDETELEKEFKDVDDVIDTHNGMDRRTPALSLEDMYIKTTTEMSGFDRNDYIHKSKGQRRKS